MAVLKMLPEMVRAEELLTLVAFAELVHLGEMLVALGPVGRRVVRKGFATISAHVELCRWVWWSLRLQRVCGRRGCAGMEGAINFVA